MRYSAEMCVHSFFCEVQGDTEGTWGSAQGACSMPQGPARRGEQKHREERSRKIARK